MKARDIMKKNVLTVPATLPFFAIQRLFVEAQVDGAPVVDEDGTVIGVLTSTDMLRTLDQVSDDEVDPGPDDLAEGLGKVTARDMATPEVVWVGPETSAQEIARRMQAEGIRRVLVGEHGKLMGLVTASDLVRLIAR